MGFAISHPSDFGRAARTLGVFIRRAPQRIIPHLAYLVEACHLANKFRRRPVDVLHAHFGTNPAAVAVLIQCLGGPPCVLSLHGPEEFENPLGLALDIKAALAGAIRCISEDGHRKLLAACPPNKLPRTHVVHCGLEPSLFTQRPRPLPGSPSLLCIGRLDSQKNHGLLFEALASLHTRGIPFYLELIGNGPRLDHLQRLAHSLELSEKIVFRGWCSSQEISEALGRSRVLVLSSRAEGLPIVALEALAACRPVVATDVGGISEIVDDTCGLLVPAGNAPALAQALAQALTWSDEEVLSRGRSGQRKVKAAFDMDSLARQIDRIHLSVCHREEGDSLAGGAS